MKECDEGTLEWVAEKDLLKLNLWVGDLIFLKLLMDDAPFFSLKLKYRGDELTEAVLDGRTMKLPLEPQFFRLLLTLESVV